MKSVWILAFLLVTVPSFAQTPAKTPLTREDIAVILGPSAGTGSCGKALAPSQLLFAAKKPELGGGISEMVTCTANCESGSVQCTADISCQAFHRNCTTACEKGHVTCNDSINGTTTFWCPTECVSHCCDCQATGDCYSCCRCAGGSMNQCIHQC